mgnify:FL=1
MTAKIKLNAASGGGSVSLKAPSTTTSNAAVELQLPVADGTASQSIITDASGNLSFATPKLPHAFVFMDSQSFTTSATKIGFNTSSTNDQSFGVTIDRTNKRLTPTIGGVYQVMTSLQHSYSSGGSNISFVIFQYKNGAEFAYNTGHTSTSGVVDNVTCLSVMSLNGSGDYVEFYAKHNGSGNGTSGTNSTFFITRIG